MNVVPATLARLRINRSQTFSSLRHRDFRFLWASTFLFSSGNWIQQITLSWLIFDRTGNPFFVGAINGARSVPFLFAGPISGVLADRMDRRKLLMMNQTWLAAVVLVFAVLVSTGKVQTWHMFAFSFLSGTGFAINNPLRQTLTANVVPHEELGNAIALNSAAFNVNRVLGPALGGVLIAAFGPGTNFFIQASSYMLVALMVIPMHIQRQDLSSAGRTSALGALGEGLAYVKRQQTILALIIIATVPAFFVMPFTTGLMAVYAKDVVHTDAKGLGYLLAVFGAGGFAGALTLASFESRRRLGPLQVVAGVSAGLALFAVSRSRTLGLALPFLAAEGASQLLFSAINTTHLQTLIPDSMRGRVMSIYMVNVGLAPLGALVAGALADFYGADTAMLAGGLITVGLMLLTTSIFRKALEAETLDES